MILIVGGLIALGLVAAIAVVLLARGEQGSQGQIGEAKLAPQQASLAPQQAEQAAVEQQAEAQMAMATADTGVPTLVETPELPEPPEPLQTSEATRAPGTTTVTDRLDQSREQEQTGRVMLSGAGEEQLAAGLASQYEVLTRELREVHQKSNEIERRLALLNEIATRFKQMQNGHDEREENEIEQTRRNEREVNTETNLRPTPERSLDPYR